MFSACIEYLEKIIMIAEPKGCIYSYRWSCTSCKIKQQRHEDLKVFMIEIYIIISKKHEKEIYFID